jgi:hypothetical protein
MAMRFYPCLEIPYGEELQKTMALYDYDSEETWGQSIYDETLYGG